MIQTNAALFDENNFLVQVMNENANLIQLGQDVKTRNRSNSIVGIRNGNKQIMSTKQSMQCKFETRNSAYEYIPSHPSRLRVIQERSHSFDVLRTSISTYGRFSTIEFQDSSTIDSSNEPFAIFEPNSPTLRRNSTIVNDLQAMRAEHQWIEEQLRRARQDMDSIKNQMQQCTVDRMVSNDNESETISDSTFDDESRDSKIFRFGEYLEYWRKGYSNSVSPKYKDLREEMTTNNVAQLSNKRYNKLCKKARNLLKERPLTAKRVGDNNDICGIEEGSAPSIKHIIALMIYTDFDYHQREFKKQCRRLSANESLKQLVSRNSEVYHWCRLIKEMCIFYGEIMGENDVLYSGMGEYLRFDSLCTRFECPISTSTKLDVATRFAKGAIILKFKRGSANTKILDVTRNSRFGRDESERLVAGSTLQIVDILINKKSQKRYVSALRMLGQIMNGHFIDGDNKIVSKLISLLRCATSPTLTDKLWNLNLTELFYDFLEDEGYESDAVMDDVVEETSSEIFRCFGSYLFAKVQKCSSDHAGMRCVRLKLVDSRRARIATQIYSDRTPNVHSRGIVQFSEKNEKDVLKQRFVVKSIRFGTSKACRAAQCIDWA